MFGNHYVSGETVALMKWALAGLNRAMTNAPDLGPDDPAYAEIIDLALPQMTLIGPAAGAELRALVHAA